MTTPFCDRAGARATSRILRVSSDVVVDLRRGARIAVRGGVLGKIFSAALSGVFYTRV
jgi:hypothetical protein